MTLTAHGHLEALAPDRDVLVLNPVRPRLLLELGHACATAGVRTSDWVMAIYMHCIQCMRSILIWLVLFGYTLGSHTDFVFWFHSNVCELRSCYKKRTEVVDLRKQDRVELGLPAHLPFASS